MPIYEYKCEKCDYVVSLFVSKCVSSEEDTPVDCDICSSECYRSPSLSSFHLKGGGWEKDGYASKTKT